MLNFLFLVSLYFKLKIKDMKYDFLKDEVLKNKLLIKEQRDKVFNIVIKKSEFLANKQIPAFIFEFYNSAGNIYCFESKTEEEINKIFLNEIRKEKLLKINLVCLEKEKPKKLVSRKK